MIKQAAFVSSNTKINMLPAADKPEFAFIGRSNVGKSSLINALTNHKGLAKTSQTPGKTQLINHFIINNDWYLVDLPGYGYAKTSKTNRIAWQKFIKQYIYNRANLQCVFVLIDSRIAPQKIDLDFCCQLGEAGIPFVLAFTKADKQSASKSRGNMDAFFAALSQWFEEMPSYFLTSAETKSGCDEIVAFVEDINSRFEAPPLAAPNE